ncbi:MAG: S-layer homology domain-containing protein [Eubacteriales bacterium]|nr:S-layer homology domain-containing protein [Eubacteriales bacterium]
MLKGLKRVFSVFLAVAIVFCFMPSNAFAATDNADDIKYSMDSDETLDFDEEDFNDECEDVTGEVLDYVKFDLPDKDEGILYYSYDEDDNDYTKVSSSKKYYYEDRSPYISRVTFVPDEDYSGTLTIKYTGYDIDGDDCSGKIKITVKNKGSSGTITYKIDYDKDYITFEEDDFFDACEKIQGEDLDYVKFTLPDDDDGILYYNYDEDGDDNIEVGSSKKYYYEDRSPYISKVTFVPDVNFSGTVTIKYTGYDVEGDSYSGRIKITVDEDDDASKEDTITYKIKGSSNVVNFDEKDFNDVCKELNDKGLDYVSFTAPSASKGTLYYKYKNGEYSSVVNSSKKYYYDSSPYISDVTFVPSNSFKGSCEIKFKGYDVKGKSFSGYVIISKDSSDLSADIINYTGKINAAAYMKDSDFNNVCKKLMGSQLNYVTFTLPSSSFGTLYYGYNSSGNYTSKIKASTKYYYDGSPYLLNVAFVPANNVSGTVTIDYTGYDVNGLSYSGKIQIQLSSAGTTTPTQPGTLVSSKYFKDVDTSYSWAVPYIDSLYEAGIIAGTTSSNDKKLYEPASRVKRGDFMLILYRALNFKTSSTTTSFADVPANSYYYTAVQTAKALGIAQGTNNKFKPESYITREDAMVLALRAMNITSTTIPSGEISSLTGYADYLAISDYSKSAVAALVKAKIITGSDDNKLYPQGNLTRAQISAIIYRLKNM